MARLIALTIGLLAAGNCLGQHKPWEWHKDQNKYVLYEGNASRRPPLTKLSGIPQANAQLIYAHDKKGYARYASFVASSYTERYGLNSKQGKILFSGLMRQYNKSGTKAIHLHFAVEELLDVWFNDEQMAQWQQLVQYPEYDPYYLEKGRGWNVYNQ